MSGYSGGIEIVDAGGQVVGSARAQLALQPSRENPTRWSGRLDIPSTPALQAWLKQTQHEILFRTTDGRAGKCVSYTFPGVLPGTIDVFGGKGAPFD